MYMGDRIGDIDPFEILVVVEIREEVGCLLVIAYLHKLKPELEPRKPRVKDCVSR